MSLSVDTQGPVKRYSTQFIHVNETCSPIQNAVSPATWQIWQVRYVDRHLEVPDKVWFGMVAVELVVE